MDKNAYIHAEADAIKELREIAESHSKLYIDPDFNNAVNALNERVFGGKGRERHGGEMAFTAQPICTEIKTDISINGHVYQIRKKALESLRLSKEKMRLEMLDIAAYALAVWIATGESDK